MNHMLLVFVKNIIPFISNYRICVLKRTIKCLGILKTILVLVIKLKISIIQVTSLSYILIQRNLILPNNPNQLMKVRVQCRKLMFVKKIIHRQQVYAIFADISTINKYLWNLAHLHFKENMLQTRILRILYLYKNSKQYVLIYLINNKLLYH